VIIGFSQKKKTDPPETGGRHLAGLKSNHENIPGLVAGDIFTSG